MLPPPPFENAFFPSSEESVIHSDLIFVFGSNLFGRHGAGAAHTARRFYGARYGNGVGPQGMSYAIPTKDGYLRVLDLDAIESYVKEFVYYTHDNPKKKFLVTAVGTGRAGYKHSDMAPLFKDAVNCWFDKRWKAFM